MYPYPIPGSRYVGGYIGVGLEREDREESETEDLEDSEETEHTNEM